MIKIQIDIKNYYPRKIEISRLVIVDWYLELN